MSRAILRVIPVTLVGSVLAATCLAGGDDAAKITRARELFTMLATGQYEAFHAAGDATMKASLSAKMAEQIWTSVTLQLGEYESEQSAVVIRTGQFDNVRLTCRFSRGTLVIRIVLDDQKRLTGLWLDSIEPDDRYESPDYVRKDAFGEVEVTVSAGPYPLPGTLSIPKSKGPHACVVLVHGSGPHDQDETVFGAKPFRDLAWGLASKGVAVLRYVKRTKKYPQSTTPEECTLEFETIDDALAAARLARERSEIDAERVFVAGHSLGGMAVPFIAQRDDKLGGIVIIAGNARSILDLIEDQIEYIASEDGDVSDEERKQLEDVRSVSAGLRAGDLDSMTKKLLGVPGIYWHRLHKLDNVTAATKLTMPIMIIHGRRDYQVTMKDYQIWQERLSDRRNVTMKLYPRLNHLLVPGDKPSTPAEYQQKGHVDVRVINDIASWIKSH